MDQRREKLWRRWSAANERACEALREGAGERSRLCCSGFAAQVFSCLFARSLVCQRQNFLNAMYAHCQRERSWVHPVATCWDVAVSVGINRVIGPEAFAQQFLAPMMEKQMILVRSHAHCAPESSATLTS